MNYRLLSASMSGAVLALGLSAAAFAADRDFCRDYAHAAVREVSHALESGRCRDQIQGPRWSTDWQVHFRWCLGVSRDQASAENDARRDTLAACHHHHDDDHDHFEH